MKRKTVEQVIRDNPAFNDVLGSEYILRVLTENEDGSLNIYIRPNDRDGETRDFILKGNKIKHNYEVKYE